jgi:serine O-acetyltransferase
MNSECMERNHHTLRGVCANLSADIARFLTKSPGDIARGDTVTARLSAFLRPELQSLCMHRIAHYLYVRRWRRLSRMVTRANQFWHRVSITPQSCIGPGCRLPHPSNVSFHGRAGGGLTVYALGICCPCEPVLDQPIEAGPVLGDRVSVGAQAVILGPVIVGDDVKVAFSVHVDRDIPPSVLVVSQAQRVVMRPKDVSGKTAPLE